MFSKSKEKRPRVLIREQRPVDASVSHYPPGKAPSRFDPGDFTLHRVLATRGDLGAATSYGKVIQARERARFGDCELARWTHATLLVSADGAMVESDIAGVELDHIGKYIGSDYVIVHVAASEAQREEACSFAMSRADATYYGMFRKVAPVVALATQKYVVAYPRKPEDMLPGDLAYFWGAASGEPEVARNRPSELASRLLGYTAVFKRSTPRP
jgi:hypothetical protein